MAKRHLRETKEEVLKKIREGQRVSEVARAHGINEMTIRRWLERDTESTAAETLEISRLKRENETLLKIMGQLTYRAEPWEKNSAVEVTNKTAPARELRVSRSSLYYRPKKPDKDEALRRRIAQVMLKNPGYESPRIALAL